MNRTLSIRGVSILMAVITLAAASILWTADAAVEAAGPPSASTILTRAYKAVQHFGTAHGVGSSTIVRDVKIKSGYETVTDSAIFAGDASTSSNRSSIREQFATKLNGSVRSAALEYVTLGSRMADRANGSKSWQCRSTSYLNTIDVWTPASFGVLAKRETGQLMIAGSEDLNGAQAWLIKQTETTRDGKIQVRHRNAYIVAKKTYALLQVTAAQQATINGKPWSQVDSAAFSHYGEHLQIRLPSCK